MRISKLHKSVFFKRIRTWYFAIVALIFVLLGFFYFSIVSSRDIYGGPKEYTIVYTDDGFDVDEILIKQGDTVRFVNESAKHFWPASSFHPTHEIYPEFDPKISIEPGGVWRFTFTFSGRWKFHDHLSPAQGGVVVVKKSLFTQNKCETKNEKIRCWYNAIDTELAKKGLEGAFRMMENLYDRDSQFASGCHDITHILGEAAFRKFDEDGEIYTSSYSVFCSYGFYHGFIEAMLHSGQDHERAISYCRQMERILSRNIATPQTLVNCFHGIGHGTFDTLPASYWGREDAMVDEVLKLCHTFERQDKEFAHACAKGTFNALTNAYAFGNYNVQVDTEDPFRLCRAQNKYIDKRACYVDLGVYVVNKMDIDSAVQIIETIEDTAFMAETLAGYVNNSIQHGGDLDLLPFLETCQRYDVTTARRCRVGIIEGIFISGKIVDAHKRALDFCHFEMLTEEERDHCIRYVVQKIYVVLPKKEADDICRSLHEYQATCR